MEIIIKQIAKEYENLKHNAADSRVRKAYKQFCLEIEQQFLLLPVRVIFTEVDPYRNSGEMFNDVEQNNTLKVFVGGEPHELLSKESNCKFRAIHDYFGHFVNKNNFSWAGETEAYKQHAKMFSKLAGEALFTETVGQNSFYNVHKIFAPQKAGILPAGVRKLVA